MKKGTIILLGIVVIAIISIASVAGSYNTLVGKEEKVNQAYSDISVQLERRVALIPNLVSTVKGYAAHEEAVIKSVTEARSKLMGANTVADKSAANDELTTALNRLLVVVENYPELKANENFINLQDELAGTENRIAVSRRDYNEKVTSYNTAIKKFPTNILAGMFGFDKKEYFEVSEGSEKVPNVEF